MIAYAKKNCSAVFLFQFLYPRILEFQLFSSLPDPTPMNVLFSPICRLQVASPSIFSSDLELFLEIERIEIKPTKELSV